MDGEEIFKSSLFEQFFGFYLIRTNCYDALENNLMAKPEVQVLFHTHRKKQ